MNHEYFKLIVAKVVINHKQNIFGDSKYVNFIFSPYCWTIFILQNKP